MSQETIRKLAAKMQRIVEMEFPMGEPLRVVMIDIFQRELAPFGALLEAAEQLMNAEDEIEASNAWEELRAALLDIQKG